MVTDGQSSFIYSFDLFVSVYFVVFVADAIRLYIILRLWFFLLPY